jgi:hypothetical protein
MNGQAGRFMAVLALCAGLAGCRHKTPPAVVPLSPPTPVPLANAPETPSKLTPLPPVPAPLTTVTLPANKVKKAKKKAATAIAQATPTPAPAPATVNPAPAPPIGVMTLGSDETPAKHQQAQELINSLGRRLAGLPLALLQTQKEQLARVVNFQQEAQKALREGDADGAMTLATKGNLLLDDLLK